MIAKGSYVGRKVLSYNRPQKKLRCNMQSFLLRIIHEASSILADLSCIEVHNNCQQCPVELGVLHNI